MGYETIYIDMVFLVNFMMDLLLLSLVQMTLRRDSGWMRLCAGALAGAVWACLAVLMAMPQWMEWAGSLASALMMTVLAFKVRRVKAAFFMSFFLLGLSFYLSGMVNLVYYHSGAGYYLQAGGVPSYILLPVIAIGSGLIWKAADWFWRYQSVQRQLFRVVLTCHGKSACLSGFVDTGNQLYEPYQGRPVHIAEEESLKDLLAGGQQFLYVPYHSVGNEAGLMKIFTAEEMILSGRQQVYRYEHPVIGLSPNRLNGQGRYQIILHPDILIHAGSHSQKAVPAEPVSCKH